MRIKAKGKRQKAKGMKWSRISFFLLFPFSFFLFPFSILAAPTQQEVLQGINESVGHSVDGSSLLGFAIAVVALLILLVLLSYRRQTVVKPRQLNNPGKLLKEVSGSINLKPAELRQLKLLAEGQELSSPLILLLCPSLMAKAVKEHGDRIDKRVVSALAQKIVSSRENAK